MGKQKQQVISRFFSPKSNPQTPPPEPASSSSPSPKTSTTVSFSPAKRKLISSHFSSNSPKKPRTLTSNPPLHERFLQKLPEPNPPPPNPSPQFQKYTPLERQVVMLKANHPDIILMVEVGYKYRFFGEDAEIAARELGIHAHYDHSFLTASIPTFRLNVHLRRLVSGGYKVGVVKQTETAAIKAHGENKTGPFTRGLSALYTKATLEAAEGVGGVRDEECGRESNFLCCIVERSLDSHGVDVRIGFVGVEVSTGDVLYGDISDGVLRNGVEALVLSLDPAELLFVGNLTKNTEKLLLAYAGPASNVRVERVPGNCFSDGGALAEVMSFYEKMSVDSLNNAEDRAERGFHQTAVEEIMNMPDLAVQALALTIRHLEQFGLERILCLGASFRPFSSNMEMHLSANTIEQLKVLRNNASRYESGSLLYLMNNTLTTYGSRLLRHWVIRPLCDKNMISARLDAVSEIAESMGSCEASQSFDEKDNDTTIIEPDFYCVLSALLTILGRSPDIQRGITRIFHRNASASEFIAVVQTILYAGNQLLRLDIEGEHNCEGVQKIHVHSTLLKKLIRVASSSSVIGSAAKLISTLNKEAAEQGDLLNLIVASDDQFPEVARARKTVHLARERLDSLIGSCRKQLGTRNLEFVSVSGTTHLIELPSDVKVPSNWIKVNSTKKMIRYHSPEVLNALDQLSLANEETMIVCRAAWDSFLRDFGRYYAEFQGCVHALASLDCLHSLATLSKNKNYIRPLFVDDDEPLQIHIDSGRHPVLDTILQDNFVPNDTCLHADKEFCQIITGPNMGGKSCYIRQVALIVIMAQVGSFVPASSAKLHVVDGIYTRMGASDSIQQGRSTFLEELSETSHILSKCTARSLIIIDELGRGTSTHDGGAIAYATLHHLLSEKRCMVLFVTHYPKIADIITEFPGSVGAYHVSYLTSDRNTSPMDREFENDDITYLYKLLPGVSEKSFGFKVALLAQLPLCCVRRATVMAAGLEEVVGRRTGDGFRTNEPVAQETTTDSSNLCRQTTVSTSGDVNDTLRSFLMSLDKARLDVTRDSAESFQFLKSARNIATELIKQVWEY